MRRIARSLLRLLWILAAVVWVAVWLYPPSTIVTRALGAALALGLWAGLIGLVWRFKTVRIALLGLSLLLGASLWLPPRAEAEALRADFVAGLLRYRGVNYFWGGESPKGIDCSGLTRRGLIDALLWRGVRTADPGLVRYALWVWWNDCTARDLGVGAFGFTTHRWNAPSLNAVNYHLLAPGDLAVTISGVHVMAYLGEQKWIEADPGVLKVITLTAPAANAWLTFPMQICRWSVLEGNPEAAH